MKPTRRATSEISYADSANSRAGRAVIRSVENLTGRLRLIRRAGDYSSEVAAGRDFWEVIAERYGVTLDIAAGMLEHIPATGPVVVVANHPYGILDGLMLGNMLARRRGDFRILAHEVFRKAEELHRVILPISFDDTREAVRVNLETRAAAIAHLAAGGCVGVFPGGTVSTAATPFGRPLDPAWRRFTARLIEKSGADVAPVFFEGANGRIFQIASHLHSTLRLALMINAFRLRVGEPVRVVVGRPLPRAELAARRGDARAMMDYLRAETYRLAPDPHPVPDYGFDFEEGRDAHANRRL